MAIIKETLPFTYDEIYQDIAKRLIEKGWDGAYEGSNGAILASVLSYIVSSLNFNTATNINENILTYNHTFVKPNLKIIHVLY